MKNYHAEPPTGWRHPSDFPPPKGQKIQILTSGYLCVLGLWFEGARAWAPLLAIEPELKARLKEEDRQAEEAMRLARL